MRYLKEKTKVIFSWLSRKFKTDVFYVAKSGFWLSLGQITSGIIGLFLTTIFANFLSKESYGTYSYILSIAGILTALSLSGMDTAVTRSVAMGREGSVRQSLVVRVKWGFWAGLLSAAAGCYYLARGNTTLAYGFFAAAVFLPVADPLTTYADFLKGRKLFSAQIICSIFSQLFVAASLTAAVYLTKNIPVIILTYFLAHSIANFFFYRLTFRKYPPNDVVDPAMIKFGRQMSFMQILTAFVNYLDRIIIFHFLGAASLAVYNIALAPAKRIESAFSIVSQMALPKLATRSSAEIRTAMRRKILQLSVLALGITIFYIFTIPYFYNLFFPQYFEAIRYSQFYSIALVAVPIGLIYVFFQSKALTRVILKYKITAQIIQLFIVGIFTYFGGIGGAVSARVIFSFILIPLAWAFFARNSRADAAMVE